MSREYGIRVDDGTPVLLAQTEVDENFTDAKRRGIVTLYLVDDRKGERLLFGLAYNKDDRRGRQYRSTAFRIVRTLAAR